MTRRNEIKVGLVVILGLTADRVRHDLDAGAAPRHGGAPFRRGSCEVGQLLTGSTVKFRGVPIGRVESIELEPTGAAVIVTMTSMPTCGCRRIRS
jgi:hypothetical protein